MKNQNVRVEHTKKNSLGNSDLALSARAGEFTDEYGFTDVQNCSAPSLVPQDALKLILMTGYWNTHLQ